MESRVFRWGNAACWMENAGGRSDTAAAKKTETSERAEGGRGGFRDELSANFPTRI